MLSLDKKDRCFKVERAVRPLLLLLIVCFTGTSFSPFYRPPFGSVKIIVIDAGHGGKDPGCHGLINKEKDIALAVALKLGKHIQENFKDVKVIYTRKTDVFIELDERANIANTAKADLFISIHCNSACFRDKKLKKDICKQEVHGSGTYVMGLSKSQGNLDIAKRENASVLLEKDYEKKYDGFDPNSDEANIIFSMYQNKYLENSLNLASKIQNQYASHAGRYDKGVHQANFLVLWRTAMPSLLTEIGFLTNPVEEKFLASEKGQNYIASSLFRAFREYKNEIEGVNLEYNDEMESLPPFQPQKDSVKPLIAQTGNPDLYDAKLIPPAVKDSSKPVEPVKIIPVNQPVVINEKSPVEEANAELIFKVQFASSDKKIPLTSEKFKGIKLVGEYKAGGVFKYTAGEEKDLAAATALQNEMRARGYKDAFVVAFKGEERIPINEALKYIKK